MREITTYPEKDEVLKGCTRIGFYSGSKYPCDCNIWIAELYKNNATGHMFVFITTDGDETWFVMDFE